MPRRASRQPAPRRLRAATGLAAAGAAGVRRGQAAGGGAPVSRCSSWSTRNASDSRERSEPGLVTLTSASSSGRRGSAPWRESSTATASRSQSRSTVGAGELVRLLAQPLARLVGDGQRVGHVAHVLDEQKVAQVLEQVGDEPAEILALLRELLQERQRAGGVAVDDRVAEAEERVLLDGAEELQHRLDVDLVSGRRRELVERRDGVAERAAAAARDQRERGVGHLDLLGVRDPPEHAHELGQPRPREDEASGSASAPSAAPWRGRSCRRRRRGAAAAPRSASAARSRRRP